MYYKSSIILWSKVLMWLIVSYITGNHVLEMIIPFNCSYNVAPINNYLTWERKLVKRTLQFSTANLYVNIKILHATQWSY